MATKTVYKHDIWNCKCGVWVEKMVKCHVCGREESVAEGYMESFGCHRYAALFTTRLDEKGEAIEVSGGGYERVEFQPGDEEIVFPTASEDWGCVDSMLVFDEKVGGVRLWFCDLFTFSPAKYIASGDVIKISLRTVAC